MTPAAGPLTDAQLAAFDTDGVLVLRGLLAGEAIDPVRAAFGRAVGELARRWLRRGMITDTHADLPFEQRYVRMLREAPDAVVHGAWRRILVSRAIYDLWQRPELLAPMRRLLGDEVWAHGAWNGRLRDPLGRTAPVSWHQDAFYCTNWTPDDSPMITVWVPLVPVTARNSCMQFVRGSHRRGRVAADLTPAGEFWAAVDEPDGAEVLTAEMDVGDVVLFTDTTLHRSTPNDSDGVRCNIDIRFARPTGNVVDNSPRGYLCASAVRPVEDYETWAARYRYDTDALADEMAISEHLPAAAFRERLRAVPDVDVF